MELTVFLKNGSGSITVSDFKFARYIRNGEVILNGEDASKATIHDGVTYSFVGAKEHVTIPGSEIKYLQFDLDD